MAKPDLVLTVGMRIKHKALGEGVVKAVSSDGASVDILFVNSIKEKTLILAFAISKMSAL